jgi:mono/diheme cytochrome c family protein
VGLKKNGHLRFFSGSRGNLRHSKHKREVSVFLRFFSGLHGNLSHSKHKREVSMMSGKFALSLLTVCALTLSAQAQADDSGSSNTVNPVGATTPTPTPGRLLASNCFQCHGTNGTGGFDRITGGEAGEIREYRSKIANKDIMAAHAQGYTPAQIEALVSYLNQLQ